MVYCEPSNERRASLINESFRYYRQQWYKVRWNLLTNYLEEILHWLILKLDSKWRKKSTNKIDDVQRSFKEGSNHLFHYDEHKVISDKISDDVIRIFDWQNPRTEIKVLPIWQN